MKNALESIDDLVIILETVKDRLDKEDRTQESYGVEETIRDLKNIIFDIDVIFERENNNGND